jgi:hypothetical protein
MLGKICPAPPWLLFHHPEGKPARDGFWGARVRFLPVPNCIPAARHSNATHVWLRIKMHGSTALIQVEDDGCGFKQKPAAPAPAATAWTTCAAAWNKLAARLKSVKAPVAAAPR